MEEVVNSSAADATGMRATGSALVLWLSMASPSDRNRLPRDLVINTFVIDLPDLSGTALVLARPLIQK
ncbi:hypothetical protein A5662_11285 [Mycobacteriaceae bacterium 1482268.1]|nr:hypothetical protein A5662_11285 [Mycobacteriaceae bacterium 1482268.1]